MSSYTYDRLNRLMEVNSSSGGVKTFDYDGRGNLTTIIHNGVMEKRFSFDATNHMVEAATAQGGTAAYTYDGFGRRIKSVWDKPETGNRPQRRRTETRYLLDGLKPYENVLMTYGNEGASRYVWGNELIGADAAERADTVVRADPAYYLHDELRSVIRVSDGGSRTPTKQSLFDYDEFGAPVGTGSDDSSSIFGFTGYQLDPVTGLSYAQARYYMPQAGRFISEDPHWNPHNMIYGDRPSSSPVPDILAIEQGGNLYVYSLNNPVMYVDLTGNLVWPGELHKAVQDHIVYGDPYGVLGNSPNIVGIMSGLIPSPCGRYFQTEAKINYTARAREYMGTKSGRLDLVDKNTGEFWEIKSNHSGKG